MPGTGWTDEVGTFVHCPRGCTFPTLRGKSPPACCFGLWCPLLLCDACSAGVVLAPNVHW